MTRSGNSPTEKAEFHLESAFHEMDALPLDQRVASKAVDMEHNEETGSPSVLRNDRMHHA